MNCSVGAWSDAFRDGFFVGPGGEQALELICAGSGCGREMNLKTGMTAKPVFTADVLCVPKLFTARWTSRNFDTVCGVRRSLTATYLCPAVSN